MKDLILIRPHCREKNKTERLTSVLEAGFEGLAYETVTTIEEFESADLRGKKLIFAVSLGESGINLEFYNILKRIRLARGGGRGDGADSSWHRDRTEETDTGGCFEGSVGGMIVDGSSELFTKAVARDLVFSANLAGCAFPGRPLVEGTRSLENYNIIAKNMDTDNLDAYRQSGRELIRRVVEFNPPKKKNPKILVLHASNHRTSNTLTLWDMVQSHLRGCEVREVSLRNGAVQDCSGCHYETCLHLGEQGQCVYGGVIVDQVYPAILECDALVLVCPNYNDAVSANIAAFINRLTALFRTYRFFDKRLFGVVVSGYSGSDIVAQQLISALNMNKTFLLPGHFAMLETANDPQSVRRVEGIEARAEAFARHMMHSLMPDGENHP
ncbi:MAG: NAD(P)H-dependent oxidoreductase [Lentisphaeria bacterium]|nr:NAD(P)H-dependent oxidoreductase [Lentisphaeria bacterium]